MPSTYDEIEVLQYEYLRELNGLSKIFISLSVAILGLTLSVLGPKLKQQLSLNKSIIRTHGGCLAAGRVSLETEYYEKVALHFELKQAIGKAAAQLVAMGETILINDGSTTYHLATYLGGKGPLTVYTNSLAMISELSRFSDIKLSILGGDYNPGLYSISGSLTENMLDLLHFDTVFLGVDAIDYAGRCMVGDSAEAGVAKAMLRSGTKKVLLADHTKA